VVPAASIRIKNREIPASMFSLKYSLPLKMIALIKNEARTVKTIKINILIFKENFIN